ncbi:MAG TPA: nuclease, partial [Pseudoxanthomonas sp.]|nr:nuclease [Pseudoxanthomonas sp.]
FFDDQNDPAIGEPVLTPAAYQMRLNKASLTVRDYLHLPDILGAVEVESRSVLQTLADRINADAMAAGQPNPQYVAYLEEGNDVGGIDVGFLVKTAAVGADRPRIEVLSVAQQGKATTWVEPGGAVSLLNDRPPLLLKAVAHFADGRSLPLTAIVVHQRSLNGAEEDTAGGERIRAKRQAQAKFLAELMQARQLADPAEKLLLMGDFNAFEFNDGYVDAMGTLTGLPSPDAQTVVPGDGADLVNPDLYNLTLMTSPDQSYSYAYDGNVQSLDHIVANRALMESPQIANIAVSHARVNADFPQTARNQANSPLRLSDHDPTVVLLKLKSLRVADLGLTTHAAANEVAPGQPIAFTVDVENLGPDAAEAAAVAFVLNRPLIPTVTAAPGWNCAAPQVTSTTRITCTVAHFAAGGAQSFSIVVPSDAIAGGSIVQLAASVAAQTPDNNPGNNTDVAVVTVVAPPQANLSLRIEGPATLPFYALSADYRISVRNLGAVAAQRPVLEVDSNTWKLLSSLRAASGWQCRKQALGGLHPVRFRCTLAGALTPGASAQFTLRANALPAPAGGRIQVKAAVRSATPDSDPADNQANFTTRIGCGFWGC